ncbi:GPP34 family phosphoprotein, partial [Angustibacter aerolatus]
MRLAEQLLVLVLDPSSGRLRRYGPPLNLALAGALLREALRTGLVRLGADGRVVPVPDADGVDGVDGAAAVDPLLRLVLGASGRAPQGRPVQRVVAKVAPGLRLLVRDELLRDDVLVRLHRVVLGVLRLGRWVPA